MALDIIITKDPSKPYGNESIEFGEVDPYERGSLFYEDFNLKGLFDYKADGGDPKQYDEYYSTRLGDLTQKFPLICRTRDYYQDALFTSDEINKLRREILSAKKIIKREKSQKFLNQLLEACELALKNNAGIILVSD